MGRRGIGQFESSLVALAMLASVVVVPYLSQEVTKSESGPVNGSTSGSSLKVEGYGSEAQKGAAGSLQNASSIDQSSSESSKSLQNPANDRSIQPNDGQSSF